jgi:hypothetical protein
VAADKLEIDKVIMALEDNMAGDNIGLDAEWNVTIKSIGMQTGMSKVQVIQIAYHDLVGTFIVLLLRIRHFKQLPLCLEFLLGNTTSINIFGLNLSTNLDQDCQRL